MMLAGNTVAAPIHKVGRALGARVGKLLVALFALMLGLSAAQIGLRYLFGTAIPWADVAAPNLVLWVGLLGAVPATGQNKHFQLDALTRFLSLRNKMRFDIVARVFGTVVCFYLVTASIRFIAVGLSGSGAAFLGISLSTIALILVRTTSMS
jgi:TRAP-type C4-dicarboxylate transport system permease small subunit